MASVTVLRQPDGAAVWLRDVCEEWVLSLIEQGGSSVQAAGMLGLVS
jgi:hypothetical protein